MACKTCKRNVVSLMFPNHHIISHIIFVRTTEEHISVFNQSISPPGHIGGCRQVILAFSILTDTDRSRISDHILNSITYKCEADPSLAIDVKRKRQVLKK